MACPPWTPGAMGPCPTRFTHLPDCRRVPAGGWLDVRIDPAGVDGPNATRMPGRIPIGGERQREWRASAGWRNGGLARRPLAWSTTSLMAGPVLVPRPCHGLVLASGPALAPCLSANQSDWTMVPPARAGLHLAGAAASDHGWSARQVAKGAAPGLSSSGLHHPFVAVVPVGRAGWVVAGWIAGRPAAPGIARTGSPAAVASTARAALCATRPGTAAARLRHAAGSGSSGCAAVPAAAPGDTDPLSIDAGKREVERVSAPNCGSSGPITRRCSHPRPQCSPQRGGLSCCQP